MSSNRAWMPLHIENYLADTGHLTAAEHGAYMLLIMSYWRDGGLPVDERLIQRMSRLSKDEWAESRDIIAALFQDGWKHKRIDEELAKADEIIEKRRNAALGRHAKSKSDASAVHVQSKSTDTGVPPRTNNQSQKEEPNGSSKKNGCRLPEDFVADIGFAVEAGLSPSQAETEAAKFRDYWNGVAGAKGTKRDWPGTWRNWVRSAAERLPRPRGSPATFRPPTAAEILKLRREQRQSENDDATSGTSRFIAAS